MEAKVSSGSLGARTILPRLPRRKQLVRRTACTYLVGSVPRASSRTLRRPPDLSRSSLHGVRNEAALQKNKCRAAAAAGSRASLGPGCPCDRPLRPHSDSMAHWQGPGPPPDMAMATEPRPGRPAGHVPGVLRPDPGQPALRSAGVLVLRVLVLVLELSISRNRR